MSTGEALRDAGVAQATMGKEAALARAREIARELVLNSPDFTVTSDDVRDCLDHEGIRLGNAAGGIFERNKFVCVGYVRSSRPARHASVIRVWRLKGRVTRDG